MKAETIALFSRIHVRLGMLFALPLVLIAATGVALGFYDALRYGSAPYRLGKPAEQPIGAAELAKAAHQAFPGGRLETLYLPAEPDRAARARLVEAGGRKVVAFLDPATGNAVAVRDASQRDLVDWLHEVHRGAISGLAGEVAIAGAAVAILLLWLSGLPLALRARHLHGRLGRIAGGGLAVVAVTGAVLAFAKPLRERFYPPPAAGVANTRSLDPARLISAVSRSHGAAQLERVQFPVREGQPAALRFADGSRVWLDARGATLREETVFNPWLNMLYPLHSGRVLGKFGPPLVALFGAGLLYLTYSGVRLRYGRARRTGQGSRDLELARLRAARVSGKGGTPGASVAYEMK